MAITEAVYGPNLRTSAEQLHVHRPGCADTDKALYRSAMPWTADVVSVQDIVHAIYDPGDFCYDADAEWESYFDDIKIFPCVPNLPYTSDNQPEGETIMATTDKIIVLAKNGRPLSAGHRTKLSSLAWFAGKVSTADIRQRLDGIGVGDPLASTWSLELPNGITVAAVEIEDDGKTTSTPRQPKAESGPKQTASRGKAAERIATLNAHKAAASAARDAGHPIPDGQLATMDAAQAGKVERARRTRQAPPAMASAS